jgi:hypothetical protein|tara:strand:+ start:143 stop:382 length:240 start_codon:yes stop_codon:yes gene_type:complete
MEMDMLWSGSLTALIGVLGFVLRNHVAELQRLQILLNRTREEMAKEYVTKPEVHADINRVLDRLERLDEKLDRLVELRK